MAQLIQVNAQVSQGRLWFVHCIYTITSEETVAGGIRKRSASPEESRQYHHHTVSDLSHYLRPAGVEPTLLQTLSPQLKDPDQDTGRPDTTRLAALMLSASNNRKVKRALDAVSPVSDGGSRGTNMHRLTLKRRHSDDLDPDLTDQVGALHVSLMT